MSEHIKAIETHYNGYRFRSRLEARWAVVFDALGIAYRYETEGYRWTNAAGKERLYLPDFFLTQTKTWVEVKGDWESVTDDYLSMLVEAVDYGGHLPEIAESEGTTRGLLLLGDIPNPTAIRTDQHYFHEMAGHTILQHHKGVCVNRAFLGTAGRDWMVGNPLMTGRTGYVSLEARDLRAFPLVEVKPLAAWYWELDLVEPMRLCSVRFCEPTVNAYRAGRGARFEHGERGAK